MELDLREVHVRAFHFSMIIIVVAMGIAINVEKQILMSL